MLAHLSAVTSQLYLISSLILESGRVRYANATHLAKKLDRQRRCDTIAGV